MDTKFNDPPTTSCCGVAVSKEAEYNARVSSKVKFLHYHHHQHLAELIKRLVNQTVLSESFVISKLREYVMRDLRGAGPSAIPSDCPEELVLEAVRQVCMSKTADPLYQAMLRRCDVSIGGLEHVHSGDLADLLVDFVLDPSASNAVCKQREEAVNKTLQSICKAESEIRKNIRVHVTNELKSRPSAPKRAKK
eukprot:TRINITY_DN1838_c0_g1_i3.p2 TRINITY_DN1838_c0_g1~~TRINITY_DN1838_c0_g1_i3.p2  ORF type:complete len:193 (-),score=34.15 TRINITY_DN1838_c0_g1_i3:139-717(-)